MKKQKKILCTDKVLYKNAKAADFEFNAKLLFFAMVTAVCVLVRG
jgi:hypothetical protein